MELVVSGLAFGICGIELIRDYNRRILFENDCKMCWEKYEKDGYKIITGLLTLSTNDEIIQDASIPIRNNVNIYSGSSILNLDDDPLCQVENREKKIFVSFYHGTRYILCRNIYMPLPCFIKSRLCQDWKSLALPITWQIEREYWNTESVFTYKSPTAKFNDRNFNFDPNYKIHYTHSQNYSFANNKLTIKNYFPQNSLVSVFAKKISTRAIDDEKRKSEYNIKFMGTREEVIEDIGNEYYGISTGWTFIVSTATIISGVYFFGTLFSKN